MSESNAAVQSLLDALNRPGRLYLHNQIDNPFHVFLPGDSSSEILLLTPTGNGPWTSKTYATPASFTAATGLYARRSLIDSPGGVEEWPWVQFYPGRTRLLGA